ncbi:TlpA family protein disulfide reductase [Rhodococcus maanshanensis]|uniref:Thiol-disulfide isomerase or thioredoxin n=1 Tax=Rhodococcus maanshanensis TaxID=183556 RepID=A0A1H7HN90_9NOCA|nr:TlpA disulfide reductase family protein [Rhodococcus maanshanensis]SEK51719.1 Thiol-disulfide isomerase or thioredoxin [Rhodococcus maanshanensis]
MRLSNTGRWSLAALVVVAALIVAIWPRGDSEETGSRSYADYGVPTAAPQERASGDTPEALAGVRAEAALSACPAPAPGAVPAGPLAGIGLECLSDGGRIDVGAALAGKPALVNLWAYWCGPCARELPALQEYAQRAGDAVTVLTVHQDPKEGNALSALTEYGVHLPGVQDGTGKIAAAVGAPNVLPVTVLVRADGTVAGVLPVPFESADQIADAVREKLGVSV